MRNAIYRVSIILLGLLFLAAQAEDVPNTDTILFAQQALYQLGYHDDDYSGEMDETTVSAITNYQTVNGLEPTGALDDETLRLLEAGNGVTCYDYLSAVAGQYADIAPFQTGDAGPEISHLQQTLSSLHYYDGANDGIYNDALALSVRRFQLANGLEITGVADASTLLRLYDGTPADYEAFLESSVCAPGDSGSRVRLVQTCLAALNYYGGSLTGLYGSVTRSAVRTFQQAHRLEDAAEADIATLRVLFELYIRLDTDAAELRRGASGRDVTELQELLSSLGYYEMEITGFYDVTTETAVRLFQLANGLEPTGEADSTTLTALYSDAPVSLVSVRDRMNALVTAPDNEKRAVFLETARGLRGQSFASGDEDIYCGFTFMQYLCVSSGIPLTEPEVYATQCSVNIGTVESLPAGTPVLLDRADADGWLLAVYAGNGRLIYTDSETNWVLESAVSDIEHTVLRAWL